MHVCLFVCLSIEATALRVLIVSAAALILLMPYAHTTVPPVFDYGASVQSAYNVSVALQITPNTTAFPGSVTFDSFPALPSGLSINSTGHVSGTPTV